MDFKSRIAVLDYLRLAAAICVCISHVLGAIRTTHHILSPLSEVFRSTTIFRVPLLFAISGFVVYLSIRNKAQTVSTVFQFLVRRWVWTLFPLLLALSFTYCYEKMLWLGGFPHVQQRTLIDVVSNVLCLTSFTSTRRWIVPTWSLSYELQYYLITAVVWILNSTKGDRSGSQLQVYIAVLALLLISLVADRTYQFEALGIWHFRWFAMGLLAGIRFSNIKYAWLFRSSIVIVGIASILEGGEYLVATKLLLLVGVLIFVETDGFCGTNKFLHSSPLFGTISYLIYLLHWPIGYHSGAIVQLCRILSLQDDYWPMFAILIPLCVSVLIAKPVYRSCDWATMYLSLKYQRNSGQFSEL